MKLYQRTMGGLLTAAALLGALSSCGGGNDDLLTYRYDYDLSQYLELGEYDGLDAQAYTIDISDEKVQGEVYATLSYYSRTTAVTERGAQSGDVVVLDYVAVCEGTELENETNVELTLGAGSMAAEIENAVEGRYAGDKFSLDVVLDESYESAEYVGKTARFDVTVQQVYEIELPVYSDAFVQGYLGYDSIEAYEAAVREQLYEYYNKSLTEYIVSQTWTQVVENSTVLEYPAKELNDLYDQIVSSNKSYAEMYGINFPSYVSVYFGMTEDEFYDWAVEQAKSTVKEEMICYAIARAENIALTEKEYEERATEYAVNDYELTSLEAFEALYDKATIRQTLMYDKVRELVAERANRIDMANAAQ